MQSRTTRMCLLAIAVAGAAVSLPNTAGATSVGGFQPLTLTGAGHHVHASSTGESDVNTCADNVAPGAAHCLSRVRTHSGVTPMLGNSGAYDPAYLQSAYNAPSANGGTGQTVAIVDAYDNPTAEADLAAYRSHFGLPPCTTANGCFQKVDQNGGTNYPAYNANWALEIALDLDMVSALCPNCHILLVEATNSFFSNLGPAEIRAALMGADVISNSYGTPDQDGIGDFYDHYYELAGIPITVSSGDSGYGPEYPASSQYVTAVGGTTLTQTTNNGTRSAVETAWSGAGSGCSVSESKPSWQTDASCANRTVSDVSAVADPSTGVWVYSTSGGGTWYVVGGTSASAPIVAAFYALAGGTHSGDAKSLYDHPSALNDITSGSNGSCGGVYLCTGSAGFDGPTGLGTPNGVTAFTETTSPVPVNTAAPTVSGSFVASGGSASSTTGSWTNTPTSYAYQWQRCDAAGANCSNVGTNASSYTPTNADLGSRLRVVVTATNTSGASAPETSDPTAVVVAAFAPVNTSPPTITDSPSTNHVVFSSAGTWSGSAETSHAMQWQLCDGSGNNCTTVPGATGSSVGYDFSAVGLSFRLKYSKTNAGGTGVSYSAALVITAAAPTNTDGPAISGRAVEGRTLAAAAGSWIGSAPVTYAYQWRRCTGSSCVDISNATKSTYLVAASDVGHTIAARVRATNGQGALDADSAPTSTVTKGLPLIFTGPAISGTVKAGHTLTTTNGTWRGTAPISVTSYQWYRCNSVGESCITIGGATRKTYAVSASDKNHALRVRVYVKNPVGSANALTAPTVAAT